jgi:hypothetical protein
MQRYVVNRGFQVSAVFQLCLFMAAALLHLMYPRVLICVHINITSPSRRMLGQYLETAYDVFLSDRFKFTECNHPFIFDPK